GPSPGAGPSGDPGQLPGAREHPLPRRLLGPAPEGRSRRDPDLCRAGDPLGTVRPARGGGLGGRLPRLAQGQLGPGRVPHRRRRPVAGVLGASRHQGEWSRWQRILSSGPPKAPPGPRPPWRCPTGPAFHELEGLIDKLAAFRGTLGQSGEQLLAFLQLNDEVGQRAEALWGYAHMRLDEDTTHPESQGRQARALNLLVRLESAVAFAT